MSKYFSTECCNDKIYGKDIGKVGLQIGDTKDKGAVSTGLLGLPS